MLEQVCDFDVQIVIGDDASSDGTAEIVAEYGKKYPHVKAVLRKENLGAGHNYYALVDTVESPYIASLEGDDYWIHKKKLFFQVRELERRKNASLCFTEHAQERNGAVYHYYAFRSKRLFTTRDVLFRDPPHTSTNVIRTELLKSLPQAAKDVTLTDTAIHVWAALHGDLIKLGLVGSVWTSSADGVWNGVSDDDQHAAMLEVYDCIGTLNDEDWFQRELKDARDFYDCLQSVKKLKKNGDYLEKIPLIRQAIELYPEDFHTRINLIRLYITLGEIEKAESEIAFLRQFEPDYPDILLQEASIARNRRDMELCKNILTKCRRQFPRYFQASNMLFNILFNENKAEEAEKIIINDKWMPKRFKEKNRARLLIRKKKFDQALEALDQIPKNVINDLNFFYAVCENGLGNDERALSYLEDLLGELPSHKAGQSLLKKLNNAKTG